MPKYVIERNMPGAGALSRDELAAIAEKSCRALEEIGSQIQWMESFITADKVYSVYIASDQRLIREHAYLSGFPADTICEVKAIIDPSTAREARWVQEHDVAKESGIY
ncbi:MAG: rane protein [Bryobacterales bacterium]|nr:rane protein [Bryobacterales bacterium]